MQSYLLPTRSGEWSASSFLVGAPLLHKETLQPSNTDSVHFAGELISLMILLSSLLVVPIMIQSNPQPNKHISTPFLNFNTRFQSNFSSTTAWCTFSWKLARTQRVIRLLISSILPMRLVPPPGPLPPLPQPLPPPPPRREPVLLLLSGAFLDLSLPPGYISLILLEPYSEQRLKE